MKKISAIMMKPVTTVMLTANLKKVRETFIESGKSHLVVTDAVGTFKGVISKTDLLEKTTSVMLGTSGKTYTELELNRIKASDLMTKFTVNLEPNDTIDYATEILLQKKFHSLPVVKNYRAVGIVTQYDLLKSYYEAKAFVNTVNYE